MVGVAVPVVAILAALVGAVVLTGIVMFVIVPVFKGIGFLLGHVGRFIGGMFRDTFRFIGAVPAAVVFALLCVLNVIIGRWSAGAHFGANVSHEIRTMLSCLYRVCLGHPLRLIGLGPALEGIEERVPAAVAEAPGSDRPSRRVGQFDGYKIVGSLPGGGSGGRLYVAEPLPEKRKRIERQQGECPERVVIKSFAIADGSSLPQIVRESRALEGARQIGLIIEHELTDDRFFYVMPYVPGDNLGTVVRQQHAAAGDAGLGDRPLQEMLSYISDVVATLDHYHRGGLWHKDIKPENIVVHAGRAHVVDLGLVTSLRSAMTLTTHGTEYFRDPEMVRMALRGVKVHEVDGAKFDIYGAAAVLYFALEGTFPSHGGLSTITRRCPEAVKWIVRRGMTDYARRYASADLMQRDLEAVRRHPNLWAMKPAELPSMRGSEAMAHEAAPSPAPGDAAPFGFGPGGAAAASAGAAAAAVGVAGSGYARPRLNIANWWTGRIERGPGQFVYIGGLSGLQEAKDEIRRAASNVRNEVRRAWHDIRGTSTPPPAPASPPESVRIHFDGSPRRSATEQIASARARAQARREQARQRRHHARHPAERINFGMVVAALAVVAAVIFFARMGSSFPRRFRPGGVVSFGSVEGPHAPVTPGQRRITLDGPGGRVVVEAPGSSAADAAADSALAPIDAGLLALVQRLPQRYLIINDHPDLRSATVRDRVAKIGEMLGRLGFAPLEDSDLEATLDARIRTEVSRAGRVDIGKNIVHEAEAAVGPLLGVDEQLQNLGCVVWLARGEGDRFLTWVLTPDCHISEIDDRILAYISSIR